MTPSAKKNQTGLETTIQHHTTPNSTKTKYMRGGWMTISKKFEKIIEISVEKETNPVNKNSQNREDSYITLDIETDPI